MLLEEIQKCKENGIKEEEIAILFRVHTDARAVVEAIAGAEDPVSDERTSSKSI